MIGTSRPRRNASHPEWRRGCRSCASPLSSPPVISSVSAGARLAITHTLGKLYLLGRDVEQDREQARDWFTRSAAQGNAYAQFFLDRFDQFRDPSVMLAATKLLHHMSRIFRDNSMPPRNPAGIRIDSKRRKRLTEKRMAMGRKADDHEEQVSYQQTM